MARTKRKAPAAKRKGKYRSIFEADFARSLKKQKIPFEYETETFDYVLKKSYTPDFKLTGTKIYLELKGVLSSDDRRKMKAVKEQHPDLDIRFVFQNSQNKLNKLSKTTYAKWADRHGFPWAHKRIPKEWSRKNN